jgi:predicted hydrolase (HD superfamily)
VRKKMKQPSFAAAVPRDQLQRAADELGVDLNQHIQTVIDALAEHADELGLGPREGATADPG